MKRSLVLFLLLISALNLQAETCKFTNYQMLEHSYDWIDFSGWMTCVNRVPQKGDTAVIDDYGFHSVTMKGTSDGLPIEVDSIIIGTDLDTAIPEPQHTLIVNSPGLILNGNGVGDNQISQVKSSGLLKLDMGNGTLSGAGTIAVQRYGKIDWSSGTIDVGGDIVIDEGGKMTVSTYDKKVLSRTINNRGEIEFTAGPSFEFTDTGRLVNLGTINMNSLGIAGSQMNTIENTGGTMNFVAIASDSTVAMNIPVNGGALSMIGTVIFSNPVTEVSSIEVQETGYVVFNDYLAATTLNIRKEGTVVTLGYQTDVENFYMSEGSLLLLNSGDLFINYGDFHGQVFGSKSASIHATYIKLDDPFGRIQTDGTYFIENFDWLYGVVNGDIVIGTLTSGMFGINNTLIANKMHITGTTTLPKEFQMTMNSQIIIETGAKVMSPVGGFSVVMDEMKRDNPYIMNKGTLLGEMYMEQGNFDNQGVFVPYQGEDYSQLNQFNLMNGALTLLPGSFMEAHIYSNEPRYNTYGFVNGKLSLAGTLGLVFKESFVPQSDMSIELFSAREIEGDFMTKTYNFLGPYSCSVSVEKEERAVDEKKMYIRLTNCKGIGGQTIPVPETGTGSSTSVDDIPAEPRSDDGNGGSDFGTTGIVLVSVFGSVLLVGIVIAATLLYRRYSTPKNFIRQVDVR